MKNIFLLTMALLLNGLGLKAQTPCPNLVTNGDFEVPNANFVFGLPLNAGCVINTYNIGTNLNTKCSNWGNLGDRTNPGTGKFLIVQSSNAINAWSTNVSVTPNTPYTFSFYVTGTVPYPTTLAAVVNGVSLTPNIITSTTPNWVKYTFTGTTPALLPSITIAIKQISMQEAFNYGIDDISFISCANEPCVSCVGNVSSPNLVTNGSFTNGNTGFTSGLTFSTGCGTGNYGVATSFNAFCSLWTTTLTANSAPNFLILDGSINAGRTVLWQTPVTLTAATDYCFAFKWALAFADFRQNFPISIDIVDATGAVVANANAHVGDETIATNLTWTSKVATWNSGTLTGSHFIAISQATGSLYRDWGIDDICFTKAPPPPCDAAFTFQNINNCGNVQFTNTSVPTTGLTYAWNFGDPSSGTNNTSALPSPTHQFTTCGTYNVCLIIAGPTCRDTICQTVTVTDNTPPIARCKPGVGVVLDANCQYDVTSAFVDNGSTDNCQIKSLVVNPAIISICTKTTVTLTVTDWCNNRSSCTMDIQTTKIIPLRIACPPDITVSCTSDTTASITGVIRVTSTTPCPNSVSSTRSDVVSGSFPCNGTIRRTWIARDACGNSSACVQIISVIDNVPPIITNCPTNQTVNTSLGQCYYTFPTPLVITATDNCDPTPSVSCTWTDPLGVTSPLTATTQFPKGVNSIKCTARDKCNNVSRDCFFTLTVVDNELPKITCPPNIVVVGTTTPPASQCKAIISGLAPTATDNCPMLNVTYTITSVTNGSTGNGLTDASGFNFMGTSSLTYTATDMAGNTASCSSTVTVRCDSCGCGSGGTLSQNLIVNGNFALGNVGFTSGLPYDNNTGCIGSGNRYSVRNTLPAFCGSWANTTARTQPNCLVLDGSETGAAVLWKNQNGFSLTQGASYCFSFWWTSAYDSITQPSFPIQVDIVDALGNVVAANIGTQNITQLPTGVWVNKTINWTSPLVTGNNYYAVIRQLSGGLFRDFAIDDICFTRNTPPSTCITEFSFQPNGCGKYTFSGFGNGTPAYTYTWNFDDPTSASNIVTGTSGSNTLPVVMHQFEVGGPHTVTLTITDATGCTNTSTRLINVPPLPTATITGNLSVCLGQTTTLTASGGGTYQWLPSNQTTASITVTPAILNNTYSVIVTDANGCKDTTKVTVTIRPIPAFLLPNQTICPRQSATLTAAGGGTYLWSTSAQTASITVTPLLTTTYSCTVTTNGCTGSASGTVTVVPVNITSGLTGYFPFNGNANDVSPTLINGIPTNVTPALASNGTPSAYNFNGTSSVIIGTPHSRGVTDQVSVVAWVKTSETARGMWVAGQYNGGEARGYLLSIGDVSDMNIGQASFSGRVDLSNYYAAVSPSSVKVNNGQWHCLVGTAGLGISGTTEWRIYVDGTLRDNVIKPTTPSIAPSAGSTHFTMGRHSDANLPLMYYKGDMDDVRVYNKVLTQCEVDSICSIRIVSSMSDVGDRIHISIFPNPNVGTFTVELPKSATKNAALRITDLLGKVLLNKQAEVGKETQTVEASILPNGMYFLQVVLDGKIMGIEKFVKQ